MRIVRFVDNDFPGFVECSFQDIEGTFHLFTDKIAVFTTRDATRGSPYPVLGAIECVIVAKRVESGKSICTIDTSRPYCIESKLGQTQFDVFAEQLLAIEVSQK